MNTPDQVTRESLNGAKAPGSELDPPAAASDSEVSGFRTVLNSEWEEIRVRRAVHGVPADPAPDESSSCSLPADAPLPPPSNLVGLALSGGGIRSATFSLGVLQGLADTGALPLFDYLSTVSGGGYTGAWWTAWLSRNADETNLFPEPERLEPERWSLYWSASGGERIPDAALSASRGDPIHHLRLFANYLTPRKGILSADTWRAATIVIRNLLLTWLVLIPLLLGVLLTGQLFYTMQPNPEQHYLNDFSGDPPATAFGPSLSASAEARADAPANSPGLRARVQHVARARGQRLAEIRTRALTAMRPLLVLISWGVLLTVIWMLFGPGGGPGQLVMTLVGTGVAGVVLYHLYRILASAGDEHAGSASAPWGWIIFAAGGGVVVLAAYRVMPLRGLFKRMDGWETRRALFRNRVDRAHSTVVVCLVIATCVLLVAGFSHDLLWWLFDPSSGGPVIVKQGSGVAALLGTIASTVFTAIKGTPTAGDGEAKREPSPSSKMIFAVAPVLVIIMLAVIAATAGRALVRGIGQGAHDARLDLAALLSAALFTTFAVYEQAGASGRERRALALAAFPCAAAIAAVLLLPLFTLPGNNLLTMAVVGGVILLAWLQPRHPPADGRQLALKLLPRLFLLPAGTLTVGILISSGIHEPLVVLGEPWWASRLALAGGVLSGGIALVDLVSGSVQRSRSLALSTAAWLAFTSVLALPFLAPEASALVYSRAAATLVVFSMAWVVGLGWMADPNLTSLHAFYKARLVRAYLGASNPKRQSEEITQTADGDDVLLKALASCKKGGPYHLINATLNLVAGRDLTTAQRSADAFMFSRMFCGSARTGYCATDSYMTGRLTLGTAVAVSGAAASPNMGSKTPSAALAMLLAFLNVRLSFWAPTPNRARWCEPQPRLWPFYLIREFLSQTNDLSTYCCISDGGHFDNTGLYALVARGCRYIVVCDCGADPEPCFEDLGNAIRRCRIDFGAEIDLSIDSFTPVGTPPHAPCHAAVGTICYSEVHAQRLGWRDWAQPAGRRGVVVWLKPALLGTEPIDVRQYGIENRSFPQQTTADQWFDEAQFESYRRLGQHTIQQLLPADSVPKNPNPAQVKAFFDSFQQRTAPGEPDEETLTYFKFRVVDVAGKQALQVVNENDAP